MAAQDREEDKKEESDKPCWYRTMAKDWISLAPTMIYEIIEMCWEMVKKSGMSLFLPHYALSTSQSLTSSPLFSLLLVRLQGVDPLRD